MTLWRGYSLYGKEVEDLYWGSITEDELEAKIIRQGRRKISGGVVDYRAIYSKVTSSIQRKKDFQPKEQVDVKAELVKEQNRSKQFEINLTQEQSKVRQLEQEKNDRPNITVKEYNELLTDKGLSTDWKIKQTRLSDLEKKDTELTAFLTSQGVSNLTQLNTNIQTTINKCNQLEKELDGVKKEAGNKQTQITTLTNENKELNKRIKTLEEQKKSTNELKDKELKQKETTIISLNNSYDKLDKKFEERQVLLSNLQSKYDELKKSKSTLSETDKEKLAEYDDLENERDKLARDKKTLEQEVLALNNQLRNKQLEVSNREKSIETLKKEKDKQEVSLNKKITEKNGIITTLSAEIRELKNVIEKLKQKREVEKPHSEKLTVLRKKWNKAEFNIHEKHSPVEWANSGFFYWGDSEDEIETMEEIADVLSNLPPTEKYNKDELMKFIKQKTYTEKLEKMLEEIKGEENKDREEEKEFDALNSSYYVQEWIDAWKNNPLKIKIAISLDSPDFNDDKFFHYLEKRKEKYNHSYTSKELAKIWNKSKVWIEETEGEYNDKKFSVSAWEGADIKINPILSSIYPQLDPNEKYSYNDLKKIMEIKINQLESEGSVLIGSKTIEWWIKQWEEFSRSFFIIIPQSDRLFPYLKKHKEKYDSRYNYKELNQIFEKEKDNMKETEVEIEKIKKQIKSLKEERQRYLPDKEGITYKWKADKLKELTKEIDGLERKLKSMEQAERIDKIRETPRSIDGWVKEFQITKPQLDKLHKLAEAKVIAIDFEKILYTWKEVEEMLNKSLPLEKKTIYSWWLKGNISNEDYILLKRVRLDVNNELYTLKEVCELVDGYKESSFKGSYTLEEWYNREAITLEEFNILNDYFIDKRGLAEPDEDEEVEEEEYTLTELQEILLEVKTGEKPRSKKPTLSTSQPVKKQTISKWFIERKVMDEDYILLKKAGVDTEAKEFTIVEVNKLIIEHDKKE